MAGCMLCLIGLHQVERLDYVVPARAEEERHDDTDLPEAEVRRMEVPLHSSDLRVFGLFLCRWLVDDSSQERAAVVEDFPARKEQKLLSLGRFSYCATTVVVQFQVKPQKARGRRHTPLVCSPHACVHKAM